MKEKIRISGFADEISADFDVQLKTVTDLGMHYISLRSADGIGVADYTPDLVKEKLLPRLKAAGVGVSSLGSPIGKVDIKDEAGFQKQLAQLRTLCEIAHLLDCRYIRMFSFYMPKDEDPADYRTQVIDKLRQFIAVAEENDVVLLHENEKEIYGDTGARCLDLMQTLGSPVFRSAFDFANFVQCGQDTEVCWDMLQPYIEYIHIKDAVHVHNENVLCGTGEGKIAQLLARAIRDEGYEGFLTLEPHLVLFESLSALEVEEAHNVIRKNKARNGAEGYAMQYHALVDILNAI